MSKFGLNSIGVEAIPFRRIVPVKDRIKVEVVPVGARIGPCQVISRMNCDELMLV